MERPAQTKAWIWGTSPNEMFWQRFGGGSENKPNNSFTELQVGVMPTQYQGFPIAAGSTRQWTEYFTTDELDANVTALLKSTDYHGVVVPAADDWMARKSLGGRPEAPQTAAFDEMDGWLASVADRTPTEAQLLARAEPWGAVEEARRRAAGASTIELAPGALFPADDSNETRVRAPPVLRTSIVSLVVVLGRLSWSSSPRGRSLPGR